MPIPTFAADFFATDPLGDGRAGGGRGLRGAAGGVWALTAGSHRVAAGGAAIRRDGWGCAHPTSAGAAGDSEQRDSCSSWLVREHAAGDRRGGGPASGDVHELRQNSRRFKRAMDLASHALAHSDIEVLRAVIAALDPGTWLDRAAHTRRPGRREALVSVARALERLDIWAAAQSMFRRIIGRSSGVAGDLAGCAADGQPRGAAACVAAGADPSDLAAGDGDRGFLAAAWGDPAGFGGGDLAAGYRCVAGRCWRRYFPRRADPAADCDYAEPAAPRGTAAYAREHEEIFAPMRRLFGMVREIATAVTHEVGAFG